MIKFLQVKMVLKNKTTSGVCMCSIEKPRFVRCITACDKCFVYHQLFVYQQ